MKKGPSLVTKVGTFVYSLAASPDAALLCSEGRKSMEFQRSCRRCKQRSSSSESAYSETIMRSFLTSGCQETWKAWKMDDFCIFIHKKPIMHSEMYKSVQNSQKSVQNQNKKPLEFQRFNGGGHGTRTRGAVTPYSLSRRAP